MKSKLAKIWRWSVRKYNLHCNCLLQTPSVISGAESTTQVLNIDVSPLPNGDVADEKMRLLFHGSKAVFTAFDHRFAKTGEGHNVFDGWCFLENLFGPCRHIDKVLHGKPGRGLVYVCLVPEKYVVDDCEQTSRDENYKGPVVGVSYRDTAHIQIVEVLDRDGLWDEVVRPVWSYLLSDVKQPLIGGQMSFLRRSAQSEFF